MLDEVRGNIISIDELDRVSTTATDGRIFLQDEAGNIRPAKYSNMTTAEIFKIHDIAENKDIYLTKEAVFEMYNRDEYSELCRFNSSVILGG